MTFTLRRAEAEECEWLSDLALRSKAHWGYDATFLAACRAELTIHPKDVDRLRVTVAVDSNGVAGFYALGGGPPEGDLLLFFVEPVQIGAGIGRLLWQDCARTAGRVGLSRIRIESDPFAEGFYVEMGATRVGDVASQSIPDRSLPVLSFDMGKVPIELRPVASLAGEVELVLAELGRELAAIAPGVRVDHIGATSMPDGITKGDVDVNLRVAPERFDSLVAALSGRFEVAQLHNWTSRFASFSDTRRGFPLGLQVTVAGSDDDFFVELRDRMREDSDLRERYDAVKRANAPAGREAYWQAKNDFVLRLRNR